MPRTVLELPNQCLPSMKFLPPSSGQAIVEPSSFLAMTGVPLAKRSKNRISVINTALENNLEGLHHFAQAGLDINAVL